ncbi:hypothetical protein LTS17_008060 [Exophiala oligosperma]
MGPHVVKRQPISCENCRNRKIRCTGGRAPCDSCVRRGFQASCHFLRSSSGPREGVAAYDDLVERIASLESLLRQHINGDASCHRQTRLPTPIELSSNASASPNVVGSHAADETFPTTTNVSITGFLLRSPGGYIRFIPHTEALNSEDVAAFMHVESPRPSAISIESPFFGESSFSRQALVELLPSKRHCDELLHRYLNVFSPLFHILHEPTLHKDYAEFCKSPREAPVAFVALLFVILAIAILTLEIDDPLLEELSRESSGVARIRSITAKYQQAATKCLSTDQFMLQHNLYTIKALVLLIYAMSHTDGPTWPLLGLTLHIATAIGCHIDPRLLGVGPVEAEERRRCWAGLKMLYQNQATCMGNLLPNPVSAEVDLPADVNDEDITENGVLSPQDIDLPFSRRPPTQMTYILYKFRLYKVATDVCRATLSFLPLKSRTLRLLEARIKQEQDEHTRRFSNLSNLPLHHQANMHILKNYTNQLYLILYRPYLKSLFCGDDEGAAAADALDLSLLTKARIQCKDVAMALLESHQQLYETAGFREYHWYVYRLGSFNAFLGASTLLAILLEPQLLPIVDDEEHARILVAVQACADRLDSMSERSEVCAKASPILRGLLRKVSGHCGQEVLVRLNPSQIQSQAQGDPPPLPPSSIDSGIPFSMPDHHHHPNHHPQSLPPVSPAHATAAHTATVDLNGWTIHPELNAIMAHLPPEQWLAPSAFSWDR